MLRVPEAAEYLRVSVRTFHRLLASGAVEYVRIMGSVRIRRESLEEFIEAHSGRENPRRGRKTKGRPKSARPAAQAAV